MMPNQTVTCTRWDELFWRDQIRWRVTIQPELNDQEPQDTATFITGNPTPLLSWHPDEDHGYTRPISLAQCRSRLRDCVFRMVEPTPTKIT